MSAITANYAPPIALYDKAVSDQSTEIRQKLQAIRRNQEQTQTFGATQRLGDEVVDVQSRCNMQGWDGYDAAAISREAAAAALKLATLLPATSTDPEIIAEPGGLLGFLWSATGGKSFSVTATPDGHLIYAGIIGKKEISGQGPFYDELPQEILLTLREFSGKL